MTAQCQGLHTLGDSWRGRGQQVPTQWLRGQVASAFPPGRFPGLLRTRYPSCQEMAVLPLDAALSAPEASCRAA